MSQAQRSNNAPPQRGWTSVVASGASTLTSTVASTTTISTVFTPKPTSLSEVPGLVTQGSTLGAAGSSHSRTSPAHFPNELVPEDWEDDV
jgi:hypothetical protein